MYVYICIYVSVNIIPAYYLHTLDSHVKVEIPPAGSASPLSIFKGIGS